jgi:hypothetical protein
MRINSDELDALSGLPFAARVVYMEGIRPFMDFVTGVVGASDSPNKSISLQSLSEVLFVEPKQGRTGTGSRSRKQARVCIDVLIEAGLIEPLSIAKKHEKRLILKCVLADSDESDLKKQGTNRAHYQGTNRAQSKTNNSNVLDTSETPKQGTPETPKQGTPTEDVIKDITTHAHTRKAGLIPDDFRIDSTVQLRLQTGGVRLVVAEYFIEEFKAEAESRGSVSFNWPAELVKYCKRWEWRYDKEQPNATGVSGNKSNSSSRASRVHQSLKDEYARAIAEEQGNQTVQPVPCEVRSQVVVPYRRRGTETSGDS